MKKVSIIIILLISVTFVKAQEEDTLQVRKYIQKVNIVLPSIGGELNLNQEKKISLNYVIGIREKSMFLEGKYYGISNFFNMYYFFSAEARNYINSKDRVLKNKRTDKFSGAYGALKLEVGTVCNRRIYNTPYYIELGPMIGFQRAIGKIWYWDVNAGVGPSLNNDFFTFSFFSSIKFGFAF